jgi:hypothetical protein
MSDTSDAGIDRADIEEARIGPHPHRDGITRGTVVEYDGWQWALITEVNEEHDKFGFILLDDVDDARVKQLESAWGCWEHFEAVETLRDSEHEYWAPIDYVVNDDMWETLGPVHPDVRGEEPKEVLG